jgi:hypothetical protein
VLQPDSLNPNKVLALPAYPMIKLWEDGFTKMGLEMAGEDNKLRPWLPKYSRYFHDEFAIEALPIKKVFILGFKNSNEINKIVSIEQLSDIKAFSALQRNSYRQQQINEMNKRNIHFGTLTKLANQVPVCLLKRPYYDNSIDAVIAMIEEQLQKIN